MIQSHQKYERKIFVNKKKIEMNFAFPEVMERGEGN
jgi:hypothetical protein